MCYVCLCGLACSGLPIGTTAREKASLILCELKWYCRAREMGEEAEEEGDGGASF